MVIEFNPNNNIIVQNQSLEKKQAKVDNSCCTDCIVTSIENSEASNAIANNAKAIIGSEFKIANMSNKKLLEKELMNLKDSAGEALLEPDEVISIINSKTEYADIFDIVNLLKANNIILDSYDLKNILMSEKITSDDIAQKIELVKELNSNPIFADIKEEFGEEKLASATLALYIDTSVEQLRKNKKLLEVLRKNSPDLHKHLVDDNSYFNLRCILDSKINKDTFENILKSNLLENETPTSCYFDITNAETLLESMNNPVKVPSSNFLNLLSTKTPSEHIEKNIELLTALKNHPKLQFLFDEEKGLKSWAISELLCRETPLTFDIAKKEEIIDFITELNAPNSKICLDSITTIDLLLKNENDTYEDGKKLVELILDKRFACNNLTNLLLKDSFAESNKALEKLLSKPAVLQMFRYLPTYYKKEYKERFYNLIDLLDYAMQKPELKNRVEEISFSFKNSIYNLANSEINILDDISAGKMYIAKLVKLFDELPQDLSDQVKYAVLERIQECKDFKLKKDNVEYINELIKDEVLGDIATRLSNDELADFVSSDANLDALKNNQSALLNFTESYPDANCRNLILYEGDVAKVHAKYDELIQKYGDEIYLDIDKDNNNIVFSYNDGESRVAETYSKDLIPLYIEVFNYIDENNFEVVLTDKQNDSQHTAVVQADNHDYLSTAKKLTSVFYDENRNVKCTKFYNQSALDGSVNIKELIPGQGLKNIAGTRETPQGIFVEKELTSCDGTKSYIKSFIDLNGNENYTYKIVDETGFEILNLVRQCKNIDENTKITSVNGKDYKVFDGQDYLEVTDMASGEKTKIDFNKIFADKRIKSIEKMLKTLPGDELIKLGKHVKSICSACSIESCFNPIEKRIETGSNKFIFLHEFGHAKDLDGALGNDIKDLKGNISRDLKLQEIFKDELANLKKTESECARKVLNYFTAGKGYHYAGEFGGLQEVVAEVNAMQVTSQSHPFLQMRTQMLQEFFPKTCAYLIKHHLAC